MAVKRRDGDRIWPDLMDYFRQDFRRELSGWRTVFKYFGILIPLALSLLVALIIYIKPIPPKQAYLATGQIGSSYRELAEKFAVFFKANGVELVLIETPGLDQGLKDLDDDDSRVNASFLTAGSAKSGQYPDLMSLGSISYSPVWIFYREGTVLAENPFPALLTKTMAIGGEGTNSKKVFKKLLALNGISWAPRSNLLEIPHQEAANRFVNGELDAVFIVDGINSPTVQKLLATPGMRVFDFTLADAYVKNVPFLEKVSIPRGALDIKNVYPSKDITLLATTVTLLVQTDMHPAIQWLFLLAAKNIGGDKDQFFTKANYFPAYFDESVTQSDIAKRYFDGGLPVVFEYFPVAIASLFDRAWVILLALFAVAYPLLKKIFSLREFPSEMLLNNYWQDLRDFENDLDLIETRADAQLIIDQLNEMEAAVRETWLEDNVIHRYFTLNSRISDIRNKALLRLAQLA